MRGPSGSAFTLWCVASSFVALFQSAQGVDLHTGRQLRQTKLETAPAVQLYHPGHAPVHVTRLRRHDHDGIDSLLQAEERWLRGDFQGQLESQRFFKVSKRQLTALEEHQSVNRNGSPSEPGRGAMAQVESEENRFTRFEYRHAGNHETQATTKLERMDSQYLGPMHVGTRIVPAGCQGKAVNYVPEEELTAMEETSSEQCWSTDESQIWVVFDTGSTNIWVVSDLCTEGSCVKKGRRRYDHTRSVTWHPPKDDINLNVQFGTGRVSGRTGIDDFHVGPLTIYDQAFGMIQVQEGDVFEKVPFEGILGLAWPAMSANGVRSFFDTVIAEAGLQQNEFAFYLHEKENAGNAIFWGGVDPAFYKGDLEYFPVVDPYYWALHLAHFKIGHEVMLQEDRSAASLVQDETTRKALESSEPGRREYWKRGPYAVLDTGTTYFTAESGIYERVISLLGRGKCTDVVQTSPDITIGLRNMDSKLREFVFTPSQYMVSNGAGEEATCSPAFMKINIPPDHGPAMVLGETFLRRYFAVFDRGSGAATSGRVGMAPSVHEASALERLRTLTAKEPSFAEQHVGLSLAQEGQASSVATVDIPPQGVVGS